MHFTDLYKSVFAVMRIDANGGRIAGTAFIIHNDPLYLITCNHVVSEGTAANDGHIKFSIAKSSDPFESFDLRQVNYSFMKVSEIHCKPELDLAILRVDPHENELIAENLGLHSSPALPLSFDGIDRIPGSQVEWLSPAATGDQVLIPRLFKGHLLSKYQTTQVYTYTNHASQTILQNMDGIKMLEVDQLFIPGVSGSPIIERESARVIGFVHGFRAYGIETNTEFRHMMTTKENEIEKNIEAKYRLPLSISISLAIDLRSVELWIKARGFIGA